MPSGAYKRTIPPKPVHLRPAGVAPLRVLPEDNALQPVQVCERMQGARLSVPACAARWERSNSGDSFGPYGICRGCEVGEANRRSEDMRLGGMEVE